MRPFIVIELGVSLVTEIETGLKSFPVTRSHQSPYLSKVFLRLLPEMSFTSIPILDMALASDPATKPGFLSDLRHALLEVGFLYLKNVGIPDDLFKQTIAEGKAFFDIPEEEK